MAPIRGRGKLCMVLAEFQGALSYDSTKLTETKKRPVRRTDITGWSEAYVDRFKKQASENAEKAAPLLLTSGFNFIISSLILSDRTSRTRTIDKNKNKSMLQRKKSSNL